MTRALDVQVTEDRARSLLDQRINSVRALVTARQHLDEVRAAVSNAEITAAKAFRAALADGWIADELRKLGLEEPARTTKGRRRNQAVNASRETAS